MFDILGNVCYTWVGERPPDRKENCMVKKGIKEAFIGFGYGLAVNILIVLLVFPNEFANRFVGRKMQDIFFLFAFFFVVIAASIVFFVIRGRIKYKLLYSTFVFLGVSLCFEVMCIDAVSRWFAENVFPKDLFAGLHLALGEYALMICVKVMLLLEVIVCLTKVLYKYFRFRKRRNISKELDA